MNEPHSLEPFRPESLKRAPHPAARLADVELERTDTYFYLRAYWHVLAKRRWTILTATCILVALVAVVSFKMRPVYQATARVEVEAEAPQIQSLSDLYRSTPSDGAFLQTQVNVLESDTLAWETIQQLGLAGKAEFSSAAGTDLSDLAPSRRGRLIRAFRERLHVELMRNSRMLEIRFESTDAPLAAAVANALVNNYAEYNFRMKYDATRQASAWMEQQLDELKAKVEKSQQALVDYERENAIVNVSDKENVVEERLADLSRDLTNAQDDRVQKESLYELLKSNPSQASVLVQDDLSQHLEERDADLSADYADALARYGPRFPKVLRLQGQVKTLESFIDAEHHRLIERIHSDYSAAQARETLLTEAVVRDKADVGRLNQLLIRHNILKREFETNQQLYDSLLQRLKDATVSAGLKATNIHVVDSASAPSSPARPKALVNLAIASIVGMILGVTLAFVEEGLDNSVKSAEDVERLIGAPALAIVPAAGSESASPYWKRAGGSRRNAHFSKSATNGAVALAVLKHPASALSESYRALRTSILLSTAVRPPQVLLITSPQPNEGKSCTSLNLALTLAQRGSRVLVVDGDLRKPGIASHLGLAEEPGLSGLLTGAHRLDEVLHPADGVPQLWALPSGATPPNPAELLSSPRMGEVIQQLRERFDHIVIDSPPLLMVTDATILSTLVDGVVLVVESGVTVRGAVLRAHSLLENAGGRVLGVVVNKVDFRREAYYYSSYSRYYHSYYDREPAPPAPSA
ncbi:MAG TPA: polysaccharide biosynthesis tyrosine autokinase [Terriglobia bacterium]|nr:polysaccharide biosynthesis tyrosine autokinase [Terriglobia bacterium]